MKNLEQIWDKYESDHCRFERVENKTSSYADVHAFNLLSKLFPYKEDDGCSDIVSCAEHDEIWLSIDTKKLSRIATEEQLLELIRCGVRFDSSVDSLAMFV